MKLSELNLMMEQFLKTDFFEADEAEFKKILDLVAKGVKKHFGSNAFGELGEVEQLAMYPNPKGFYVSIKIKPYYYKKGAGWASKNDNQKWFNALAKRAGKKHGLKIDGMLNYLNSIPNDATWYFKRK